MNEQTTTSYPTTADTDGFFYQSEEDQAMGITTKQYDNGNLIKRALLPKCGKEAIVRELLAPTRH